MSNYSIFFLSYGNRIGKETGKGGRTLTWGPTQLGLHSTDN